MARPKKIGLDYFPFDVDFFDDDKISAVFVQYGIKGEIAAIKLLCAIYRNGYFIEWRDTVRIKMLKELPGISESLLDDIVKGLLKWGFFDKSLFESDAILTSRGIQRRYFSISKRNKRVGDSNLPYLIPDNVSLNAESSVGKATVQKQLNFEFQSVETELKNVETELKNVEIPQSKLKEIKEKENKGEREAHGATPATQEILSFEKFKEWLRDNAPELLDMRPPSEETWGEVKCTYKTLRILKKACIEVAANEPFRKKWKYFSVAMMKWYEQALRIKQKKQ